MAVKLILILVFLAMTVVIGIYSRKHTASVGDFVLGGRKVGAWLTSFAYGTSYFSAVVFIGYAGQFGWKYGLASTWIGVGNAVVGTLLAWLVLAPRTRMLSQHLDASTMPEFFGARYDSRALKIAASLIVFIFLIPYTASVYNGLSRLFGMAFSIPYEFCVLIMAAVTCVYVIAGGYIATAINDFIQGIIMLAGIAAVIIGVLKSNGGFMESLSQMGGVSDAGVPAGSLTSLFGPDPWGLLGVIVLTSLGTWGLPQMVHKFYAIKDKKAITTGTVISTVFALVVSGGCYFMGGFGRLFGESVEYSGGTPVYDSIVPAMVSRLPELLIGIVVVLVLSASMSTLSSLVLTSSSTLTIDFIKDLYAKKMDEKKQLLCMRLLLVFFVAVSAVIAIMQYRSNLTFIAQLMGISWGALAGAFLAPFLYGLYWKGVTRAAVWASFIFGVGLTVSNMAFKYIASPINAGAIAMVGGLVIVPLISLLTPKLPPALTKRVFSCLPKKKER